MDLIKAYGDLERGGADYPERVWDGTTGLLTRDLILVSGHHSSKGKKILRETLPGFQW